MQQKFCDTDIQTDQPLSDVFSEKDLPKDKINKKKLIFKEDLYRVFKFMKKGGQGYRKPAKYDEITFRYTQISQEQFDDPNLNEIQILETVENQKCNIGYPKDVKWLDPTLQTMKKGEITIIIQEFIKLDQNELKILDRTEYILIQISEWTTIIDLMQDMQYLKRIEIQGNGNERCELTDEILGKTIYNINNQVSVQIQYRNQLVHSFNSIEAESTNLEEGKIPRNAWRVLKSMKEEEKCICTVKDTAFRENEDPKILQNLQEKVLDQEEQSTDNDWIINIELKRMIKVDDIYGDRSFTKKVLRKGVSTGKPDKVSDIEFNLWIYSYDESKSVYIPSKERLIYSNTQEFPQINEKQNQNPEQEDQKQQQPLKYFIDDMKVSKLLRQCLLRTKKRELSVFISKQAKQMLKLGFDKDNVIKYYGQIPDSIIYIIEVIRFTEGRNNFTMTLDEKIEQAIRKKKYGLEYIKQLNYEKALKIFRTINAYFDYGTFTEEDKIKMKENQVSSLLNTSLCQLKLELWNDVLLSTNKILGIDPDNPKAILRICTAYKNLGEYEKAQGIIENTLSTKQCIPENFQSEMQKLRKEIIQKKNEYKRKQKLAFSKLFE